jgi:H-type lectin domain-containing protein
MAGPSVVIPQAGDEITASWGQSVAAAANGIQSGTGSLTYSASPISAVTAVTFPKPFASTPVVVVVMGPTSIGPNVNVGITALSATGFSCQSREVRDTAQTATATFQWIAQGVLA